MSVLSRSALAFAAVVTLATSVFAELQPARPTNEFLDSVGIVTTFPDRGQPIEKTIEMVKFLGLRWVRGGIEGVTDIGPTTIDTYLKLHKETGVKFSWGLVSGGTDLDKLFKGAKALNKAGALLAMEGNNEPNNWGVTYKGVEGAGKTPGISWKALAQLQADMYARTKADPDLKNIAVWSASEMGAQNDDCGLQFLTIPKGANTEMPDGTKYADAANVHNYIYHPRSPVPKDNKVWLAASPGPDCDIDGLYGNHGLTWNKPHFKGYSEEQLKTLPRVTTETGTTIGGAITEERQALDITNFYLAQFTRGWSHTSPYLLRDREDEDGNQKYGFYGADYKPRMVATYVHNMTTILADKGKLGTAGQLDYTIANQPATVHDLLLQNSDGNFQLVVWGEKLEGEDKITLKLAKPATVKIYDLTKGTDVVETKANASTIDLTLSNHALILEIPSK